MVQSKITSNDVKATMKDALNNSLNYENHSIFTKYDYEENPLGSVLNLCDSKNVIIDDMLKYLKENSSRRGFSEEEVKEYAGKPMKLSLDTYNTTEYWWIILAINGYFNPFEFHSFTSLLMPSTSDIQSVIDKNTYADSSFGKIPE